MPEVIVGPMLRHIGETTATVWVETDAPCEVELLTNGGFEATDTSGPSRVSLPSGRQSSSLGLSIETPNLRGQQSIHLLLLATQAHGLNAQFRPDDALSERETHFFPKIDENRYAAPATRLTQENVSNAAPFPPFGLRRQNAA